MLLQVALPVALQVALLQSWIAELPPDLPRVHCWAASADLHHARVHESYHVHENVHDCAQVVQYLELVREKVVSTQLFSEPLHTRLQRA